MEILLRLQCPQCRKSVIVEDNEVEDEQISCPYCQADIDVPVDDE